MNVDAIVDALCAASREMDRRDKMTSLRARIAKRECGDCRLWMTRACPRETSDKRGRQRGPSMSGVPCSQYAETELSAGYRAKLAAELAGMETT